MDGSNPAGWEDVNANARQAKIAGRARVLILGAGFAGLAAVRALAKVDCEVTIVDRRNYHLFQPLLYQVATAALSPADIANPIRSILSRQKNARVLMGRVIGIDAQARRVELGDGRTLDFDYLVVATGARHAYFGHDDWEKVAPGLKKIDDATDIRRRILMAFEAAEVEVDEAKRRALLTFVVIGGGPTGVEMAGAIAELARWALARDFRAIDPKSARVLLIEAGKRLLPAFSPGSSDATLRALERLGVETLLGVPVQECTEMGVRLGDREIAARTVVWAAGVAASPAGKWLAAKMDRLGRVVVEADLTLSGHDNVWVVGDTASALDQHGKPVPGLAPAAKQMGRHAARAIGAAIAGKPGPGPFRYKHWGSLATIGRQEAVAEFGKLKLTGRLAWWFWGIAHIFFLVDFRSRILVGLQWLWSYATYRRGARLITGNGDNAP